MRIIKLALIGHPDDKRGIMAAISRAAISRSETPISSLGVDLVTITRIINGEMIKIQIVDTPCHERFNVADAAILIYDQRIRANFETIKEWISEIYTTAILVARSAEQDPKEVTSGEGKELADENNALFHEIVNVNAILDAIDAIASKALQEQEQKRLEDLVQWSSNNCLTINELKEFIYQGCDLSNCIRKLPEGADKAIKTLLTDYHNFEQEFRSSMPQFRNRKFSYEDNKILYSLFEISQNYKNTWAKSFFEPEPIKAVAEILKKLDKFVISTDTEFKLNRIAIAKKMQIIEKDGTYEANKSKDLDALINNLFSTDVENSCVQSCLIQNMPPVLAQITQEYLGDDRNRPSPSSSSSIDGSSSSTDGSSSSTDDKPNKCNIM